MLFRSGAGLGHSLALPQEPDRAVVRIPHNGVGMGVGGEGRIGEALAGPDEVVQAVPRRSAGSARSVRTARSTSARNAAAAVAAGVV